MFARFDHGCKLFTPTDAGQRAQIGSAFRSRVDQGGWLRTSNSASISLSKPSHSVYYQQVIGSPSSNLRRSDLRSTMFVDGIRPGTKTVLYPVYLRECRQAIGQLLLPGCVVRFDRNANEGVELIVPLDRNVSFRRGAENFLDLGSNFLLDRKFAQSRFEDLTDRGNW